VYTNWLADRIMDKTRIEQLQEEVKQPLGRILVNKGVISEDQLRIALQEQGKSHQPLGRLLVRLGFLSDATIRDVLSENLDQESIDLATVIIDPAALALIPKGVAQRYQLLPLSVDQIGGILTLAIADPDNIIALDQVRALLKDEYRLIIQLASESDILRGIDQYYERHLAAYHRRMGITLVFLGLGILTLLGGFFIQKPPGKADEVDEVDETEPPDAVTPPK